MPEIKFPSAWLKLGDNVSVGDLIQFNNAGEPNEEGQYIFEVTVLRDGMPVDTKKFGLNKTNYKIISELYGTNSDEWVGKQMQVNKVKVRNPQTGSMVDSIILEAPTE